jgi:hypothetical protein
VIAPENPNTVHTAITIWGTIFGIIAAITMLVPVLALIALAIDTAARHGIH